MSSEPKAPRGGNEKRPYSNLTPFEIEEADYEELPDDKRR